MNHEQMIMSEILRRCKQLGIDKSFAETSADIAIANYKINNYKSVSKLIDLTVTKAKSLSKKKGK